MKRRVIAFLALLSLTAGCRSLAGLHIENPTYSIREVRPHVSIALPISASSIDLDFDIGIENPNSVGLNLDRIVFDVLVNDSHVMNGISSDRVSIPARGTGEVRLRTSIGYNNLKSVFRDVADVIQGDRANYQVQGRAYYRTPLGVMDFPFNVVKSRF
ncbi:MAG TPA: LEA type 2 family protein [Thermoanaerobaculia bacterium]|nr:LEA type 2 family protein [Thermoanaerobaculia bacterium]